MFDGYRRLLSKPGASSFVFAGLLSRLVGSMFNISLILMIQIQYSSYAVAGRVAAIGVFVWALQTVPTARIVDRLGQRAAMWPMVGLHVVGVVIAISAAMARGPEFILWIAVVFASLTGPLGSLTRARWSHLLTTDQEIHAAFSLEGALDETLYIAGPALSVVLATSVHPAAGLVVSTAALVTGMAILLPQTATEPPPRTGADGASLGLRVPLPVVAVSLIAVALGLMFGAFDLSTVAFADSLGQKRWAGAALGVLSIGSFLGGLTYGSRKWNSPLWSRIVVVSLLVAAGFSLLAAQPNLVLFGAVGFFAGSVIAPLLASSDNVIQRSVKKDQLMEGLAWLRIGIGIGVGAGAWLAGALIEKTGARAGLALAGGSAVLVAVAALATIPWLRTVRGADADADGIDLEIEAPPVPPSF
jgi:predicted MFS family arabinose efflux permease